MPFKGTLDEAVETASTVFVPGGHLVGSGSASHLGRFTLVTDFTRTVFANFPREDGTATWVGANGDQLFTSLVGIGSDQPFNPITFWREFYDITGGTGRFAEASGRIIIERDRNDQTLTSSGTISGTIDLGH